MGLVVQEWLREEQETRRGSPDRRRLAVGSSRDTGGMDLWDVRPMTLTASYGLAAWPWFAAMAGYRFYGLE